MEEQEQESETGMQKGSAEYNVKSRIIYRWAELAICVQWKDADSCTGR